MTAAVHSAGWVIGLVLALVGAACVVAGAVLIWRRELVAGGCLALLGIVILALTLPV